VAGDDAGSRAARGATSGGRARRHRGERRRAVGPALGGFIVGATSPAIAFLLNAASFVGVLFVVARWRPQKPKATLPPERVLGAMRAGIRYVRHSPPFHAVLVRCAAFVLPASAVWALLPLVARQSLGLDATGYGIVLGGLGAGAITGAIALPRLTLRVPLERLLLAAMLLFAITSGGLAVVRQVPLAFALTFVGGIAWMTTMSSITVAGAGERAGMGAGARARRQPARAAREPGARCAALGASSRRIRRSRPRSSSRPARSSPASWSRRGYGSVRASRST
jgi:MFS family permease